MCSVCARSFLPYSLFLLILNADTETARTRKDSWQRNHSEKDKYILNRQSYGYYCWTLCRQFHASSTTRFLIALWGNQVLLCFDLEICEHANRPVYIPYQRANSRQVLIASTQCQFNRQAREKQRLYDTAACICMGLFLPMTRRFLLDLFSKITIWSHELQFLI